MAVTVTTHLPRHRRDDLLAEIERESAASAELTPRSRETLERLAEAGDLVVAFEDGVLAGWGIREPLAPGLKELGMVFVKPQFRSAGVFAPLAHRLVEAGFNYVVATYNPAMVRFVQREFGFVPTTLGHVIRRSRGRFLTKRFDRRSRHSIGRRIARSTPLYAILVRE